MSIENAEMAAEAIELTLDGQPAAPQAEEEQQKPAAKTAEEYLKDVQLSESERKTVDEFSQKIDITDSAIVMQYGAACQKKIADFSDSALNGVKTKDLGEVSGMITDLVVQLKGFSTDQKEEKKGLFGFFKKAPATLEKIKAEYSTAEANVDKIAGALESHQNQLSKDIVMLDKLYGANLTYFKELTMYIVAGKKKLEEERAGKLAELKAKAEETGLAEDAQAANDFAAMCDRFEKKLYDLELTRTVSIQMAPQIRLIQNSDVLMVERIQSTINNTIPLWKNQMVLAMGMAHAQQTAQAQHEVNELTNELLKKNAETLKQGTVAIAQESERGVVDIETLQETNQKLIETFDEVLRIQDEGREKRAAAESELGRIEAELREKMLDIRG